MAESGRPSGRNRKVQPGFAAVAAAFVLVRTTTAIAAGPLEPDPPNWGIQGGGPAIVEIVYRPRIIGPLHLELGFMPLGPAGDASLGTYVELTRQPSFEPYVATNGAVAFFCSEANDGEHCSTLFFLSARAGIALVVGHEGDNRLDIDAGVWWGKKQNDEHRFSTLLIPMGGLGYYW